MNTLGLGGGVAASPLGTWSAMRHLPVHKHSRKTLALVGLTHKGFGFAFGDSNMVLACLGPSRPLWVTFGSS